jgi:hypothetical protein
VFDARTVWCALQHAIRSILGHERQSRFLDRILELSDGDFKVISRTHANAIGFWLALRISARELLPMVVNAGSFLQMKGFDWVDDDITQAQFLKAFPSIYTAWCYALLDCVEKVEEHMRLELEHCMKKLGWKRNVLLDAISRANTVVEGSDKEHHHKRVCTRCKDDYGALGFGLVEPTRIAITECIRTNHKFKCACLDIHDNAIDAFDTPLPIYPDVWHEEDSDTGEEFFDAESHLIVNPYYPTQELYVEPPDIFLDTAIMLYRSHGRIWMGEYEIGDHLCATCFLLEEQYISEDGLGTDFPPMPKSFEGLRVKL